MTFREIAGLALLCVGIALIPVGFYASRAIWLLAVLVVVVGIALFYTKRVQRNEKELDKHPSNEPVGSSVPGDIHNSSGWRTGGRRNEIESDSSPGDAGD